MSGILLSVLGGGVADTGVNATGGNETVTTGGFTYHVFTGNGTLSVTRGGTAKLISLGGGGSGGCDAAGGGGAGEVDSLFEVTLADSTSYSVTIGAGGITPGNSQAGANGGNTIFGSLLTSLGGGGGANQPLNTGLGRTGGSGGGNAYSDTSTPSNAIGSNTNVGGAGLSGFFGGGGGGATQAGFAGNSDGTTAGGKGGLGIALTAIDSNLTTGNFTSFTTSNSAIVASGGSGSANAGSANTQSQTGSGTSGTGSGGTTVINAVDSTSFGSGGSASGAGGGSEPERGRPGIAGLLIVRYE